MWRTERINTFEMSLWRKIIFTLVAVVSTLGVVRAQQGDYERYARFLDQQDYDSRKMEMGVSIGASYMGTSCSADMVSVSPKMGLRAALEMSMVWDKMYALQMEVAYLKNKADAVLGGRELTLDSSVVEVPLMFSYRGFSPLRVGAGVVLSPVASGRYDTEFERLEFGQMRSMVGYVADVGVNITQHLIIDARLMGNFGKVHNYFEGLEFTTRSWWASFGLVYMF